MKPLLGLVLLYLIGNAALLGIGYYWLSVGESTSSMLALSIVTLLIFTTGIAWLHGSALAFFRETSPSLGSVFARVARHLVPLVLLGVAVFALYLWLGALNPASILLSVASFLTMTFQKPVRPSVLLQIWQVMLWLLQWWVFPVLLLPAASGIAQQNWRGFGEFGAQFRNWKYWLVIPILLLAGIWLPLWLAAWTPVKGAFALEMTSFVLRLSASYLLFVAACLTLAFVTSRGKPALSQLRTASSP